MRYDVMVGVKELKFIVLALEKKYNFLTAAYSWFKIFIDMVFSK